MPNPTELYIKILFVPHREQSLCLLQNQSNNIRSERVTVYCENHRKHSGVGENDGDYFIVDSKYIYQQLGK
jgi:hypothetical protein